MECQITVRTQSKVEILYLKLAVPIQQIVIDIEEH